MPRRHDDGAMRPIFCATRPSLIVDSGLAVLSPFYVLGMSDKSDHSKDFSSCVTSVVLDLRVVLYRYSPKSYTFDDYALHHHLMR